MSHKTSLFIKICGFTRLEDALAACEYGVDVVGFIFAESPRRITPQHAKGIIQHLPDRVGKVGLFVDETINGVHEIARSCNLDYLQLHGYESPEYCAACSEWKILKGMHVKDAGFMQEMADYRPFAFLLDTYSPTASGGTGKVFDWDLAIQAKAHGRIVLAGGLTPSNVAAAVEKVQPFGIDVASGVEKSPGIKDHVMMKTFIENARNAL